MSLTLGGDIYGGGQLSLDLVHRGLNLGALLIALPAANVLAVVGSEHWRAIRCDRGVDIPRGLCLQNQRNAGFGAGKTRRSAPAGASGSLLGMPMPAPVKASSTADAKKENGFFVGSRLRQQVAVLKRKRPRPFLNRRDPLLLGRPGPDGVDPGSR